MSTHNICFRGEIRKILCGYPLLSVAMRIYTVCQSVLDLQLLTFLPQCMCPNADIEESMTGTRDQKG